MAQRLIERALRGLSAVQVGDRNFDDQSSGGGRENLESVAQNQQQIG
jgi:hypothetical protein